MQKLLKMETYYFYVLLSRLRYIKCNRSYKVKYYRNFTWCCKVNFKTNPSQLETKQDKLCFYTFKFLNCKSNYQADSNTCLF